MPTGVAIRDVREQLFDAAEWVLLRDGPDALTAVFGSVAVAIVPLITFRDELRARLRQTWPAGVPVLTQAVIMIASYLSFERGLGRIAADADVDTLAPTLIGAGHLLFADRKGTPPQAEAVRRMVATVLAGAT